MPPPNAKAKALPPASSAPPADGLARIAAAAKLVEDAEARAAELRKRLHDANEECDRARQALRVTIREETDPAPRLFQ